MHRLAFAALFLLMSCSTTQGEEVEFPTYTSWASRPIGTTVTIRSKSVGPVRTVTSSITSKLLEVGPEKLVIENVRTSDATGETQTSYPERLEIRRKFPLFPGVKKEDIGKPPKTAIATGTEVLDLAGRKINAFWYDEKGSVEAGPTESRTWLSNDVPGRMVKSVIKVPIANLTITRELVEFTEPKTEESKPK
ncbi:MAG: hypothetical protein SFX72_09055 [Isosphaeraceae bacterium]|nr:hypothetical protein [Isosphaeraceae bacterium]